MSEPQRRDNRLVPEEALDDAGRLRKPDGIPLGVLVSPEEIIRFAESVAELTQTECSVLLYDPLRPRPVRKGEEIQIVRAPICQALNGIRAGELRRCVRDVHAAAHAAMSAASPVAADCVGGEGTLYACPILLRHDGARYPKAAVVAAAQDIYHFHYGDRLAAATGRPVVEVDELMCQTDKRCLNAAQLRRIRTIMETQTRSYSQLISDRYAQFESALKAMEQEEALSRAYQQLDSECRMVGKIQLSLVPQQPPAIPGFTVATHYRPARRAGGDYYDFFSQPDGSWGVLVADVTGHGPGAAVVMAMVRAILYTFPGRLASPVEALEYANRHLCESMMEDQFVTACFGVLDPGTGALRLSLAGHEAPLLYDADAREVRKLVVASALPMGITCEGAYHQSEAEIKPGDILLLYTDGITDVRNAAGRLFGMSRLVEALRAGARGGAEGVRDAIVEAVARFAEGEVAPDDQTLVVLQRG